MRSARFIAIVAAATVAAGSAQAGAAERLASPTGVPSALCNPAPCDIQTAVESALNGDVVTVLTGSYTAGNGALDRLEISADIDVRGEPGQPRPVLTSAASTGGIFIQNGGSLSRFELVYTDPLTVSALGVLNGDVHGVVVQATSPNQSTACQILEGSITDSVCIQSGSPGGRAASVGRGGVGSSTATLRNDTLIAGGAAGRGLFVFASDGQETANVTNVIADGGAFDIRVQAVGLAGASATLNIDHSNFDFASVSVTNDAGTTATFNSLAGNQDAALTPPIFSDANFHQAANSPTINAGAAAPLTSFDLDDDQRCLGTAPDIGADEFVAPPCDADGDGVPDVSDNCPAVAGPVSAGGCPDADGDGVPDASDNCPSEAGLASNGGCPIVVPSDTDGDGVPDGSDSCPTQAGSASNNGCPLPADTVPPETTITKGPKGEIDGDTATFKFRSDEASSTFECKLDRGKFKPCASPKKLRNLDEGKHTFKVRATDAAGNTDSSAATRRFKVADEKRK